jgi:diketogulonate reductase-like aldo/keto reductase
MAGHFEIMRRDILKAMAAMLLPTVSNTVFAVTKKPLIQKAIPVSGELLPVIGLGTSQTFDVAGDAHTLAALRQVLDEFFLHGGRLIDSSPMYGRAEQVTGQLIAQHKSSLFAATKVWTDGAEEGIAQMKRSFALLGVEVMDLMQIHNLRDWKVQLKTLRQWKEEGRIRYIGITTSHGRSHAELETILKTEAFDFVQLTYNIANREAEKRLLPLAQDKGIAVLANRPFQRGTLFKTVKGRALPEWASELDCSSWGQIFLKYIVSHPAVTCAIPATSKLNHMTDNMLAGVGNLPDQAQRQAMQSLFSG